jgi:hypothetical protein
MCLDSAHTQDQRLGYILIGQALRQKTQYFHFAFGERFDEPIVADGLAPSQGSQGTASDIGWQGNLATPHGDDGPGQITQRSVSRDAPGRPCPQQHEHF